MIILNFSHPLTDEQQNDIQTAADRPISEVRHIPVHLDNAEPFEPQITALIEGAGLSTHQWQTQDLLINPPAYAPVTAVLLAELHGRMGYFPAVIRLRPFSGATPPRFELAEIINLHQVRANARDRRAQTKTA